MLGDIRLLRTETVDAMTTNRLTPERRICTPFRGDDPHWRGQGFALGVAIKDDANVTARGLGIASVGSFG